MDLNTITEVVRPRLRQDVPRWQDGDGWLAGGTWLFSEPQPRLRRLVDLTGLRWPAITIDDSGLRIAATCTIAQLDTATLPAHWTAAPLIGQCCRAFLASFKVWNTATVGGNICMSLPAGPMISLASALDGALTIWTGDGGERQVPVIEFVTGAQRNALKPGEIVREIELPAPVLARRAAFRQVSLNPHGRSAALLIGTLSSGGALDLTVTASTERPLRLAFPALPTAAALRDRIERDIADALYFHDVHGDKPWRKHLTALLAEEIRQELAA